MNVCWVQMLKCCCRYFLKKRNKRFSLMLNSPGSQKLPFTQKMRFLKEWFENRLLRSIAQISSPFGSTLHQIGCFTGISLSGNYYGISMTSLSNNYGREFWRLEKIVTLNKVRYRSIFSETRLENSSVFQT